MSTIKRMLVHEIVAEEIEQYIKNKDMKRGDKLPSASDLAEMYGVSRSSLREALRYLEANDIIEVLNGKGIYVKDGSAFRIQASFEIQNEKKFLLQMLDVRRALEGKAVELAVKNATEQQIQQMQTYLAEYEQLRDKGKDTSKADLNFHQTIYHASHNPVLETVIESISDSLIKFWLKPFGIDNIFDDTFSLHVELLNSIKERNSIQAQEIFKKLMDCVEEEINMVPE
ncbi:FadR/GntR family transcriptional regulator [Pseudalkalibacillus caeni]|uniref:FadR family transcriptional regulator n=1 Tax=Exobacillus caeni TaxID=2574798 RepID=A0A5R9FDJ6_9BACL|nr:FadR/GntR family transcriptional regulator [Pseudalkalibacillus caeni]TLS38634.1 FadR family transcriptional regulator [Pseudalkalibacillus caeni]